MRTYLPLKSILIVGGGRWSRVILNVLDIHLPLNIAISIFSKKNISFMRRWARLNLSHRSFHYYSCLDDVCFAEHSACIVANSAHDHEYIAAKSLLFNVPVLVEKPLAPSLDAVHRLITLEQQTKSKLCCSLVFSFAKYIQRFVDSCAFLSKPIYLQFDWLDSFAQINYGESKSFDPSIPVFVDCLPHIFSIISPLIDVSNASISDLILNNGGSNVCINLYANKSTLSLNIARNYVKRVRLIKLYDSNQQSISLDFSTEPGVLDVCGESFSADPLWGRESSPLASMLLSFLDGVLSGTWDDRFNSHNSIPSSCLSNSLMPIYHQKQDAWVSFVSNSFSHVVNKADLAYALKEISMR